MIELDSARLDDLVARARQSPRRRLNLNLHESLDAPVHRLAIAIEPDSYIRPHRHRQRWEMLMALRGRFDLLFFDEHGTLQSRRRLAPQHQPRQVETDLDAAAIPMHGSAEDTAQSGQAPVLTVIQYPPDTWHALIALDSGSVFFEIKEGPMLPPGPDDWLAGTPPEGDPDVPAVLERMRRLDAGQALRRP